MSDEIVKELPGWFVDRMREWARAILFPDGSDVPSSWPSDGPTNDSTGFYVQRTPRMLGKAHDTDIALSPPIGPAPQDYFVAPRYAWAVRTYWLYEGRSLREHGASRGINHETFGIWVRTGHQQLMKVFATQAQRRKAEINANKFTREKA